jgi:nicotinamidase-related amidase
MRKVKSPYTLLVIDLQYEFRAARKKQVLHAARHVIAEALRDRAHVVLVEFSGCGRTSPMLTKVLDNPWCMVPWHVLKKYDQDGSDEVVAYLRGLKLPRKKIRVVGVNTDQCVLSTVVGLSEKLPQSSIEVVSRACNSDSRKGHHSGLEQMAKLRNVQVVA